eukprot:scaffold40890_cov62-Attheya_sp.AAC.4
MDIMGDPTTKVLALSSAVVSLKDLVGKLEAHQGSAGLFVAEMSFLSYLDTEAWVTLNLPVFCYGLYVDGHTLLGNLMSAGHVEYSTTIDEAHKALRLNFLSGYEARVHGSFVNVLPTFFGQGTQQQQRYQVPLRTKLGAQVVQGAFEGVCNPTFLKS